jgi:hypothetical protein
LKTSEVSVRGADKQKPAHGRESVAPVVIIFIGTARALEGLVLSVQIVGHTKALPKDNAKQISATLAGFILPRQQNL